LRKIIENVKKALNSFNRSCSDTTIYKKFVKFLETYFPGAYPVPQDYLDMIYTFICVYILINLVSTTIILILVYIL